MDWLKSMYTSNIDTCSSWRKHHSAKVSLDNLIPGLHFFIPPINKKIEESVEVQYHCMVTIKGTIKFINNKQVLVDVSDQ